MKKPFIFVCIFLGYHQRQGKKDKSSKISQEKSVIFSFFTLVVCTSPEALYDNLSFFPISINHPSLLHGFKLYLLVIQKWSYLEMVLPHFGNGPTKLIFQLLEMVLLGSGPTKKLSFLEMVIPRNGPTWKWSYQEMFLLGGGPTKKWSLIRSGYANNQF